MQTKTERKVPEQGRGSKPVSKAPPYFLFQVPALTCLSGRLVPGSGSQITLPSQVAFLVMVFIAAHRIEARRTWFGWETRSKQMHSPEQQ